jgi:hypothetical protein
MRVERSRITQALRPGYEAAISIDALLQIREPTHLFPTAGSILIIGTRPRRPGPFLGVALLVAADLTEYAEVKIGVADPVFYRRGGFLIFRVTAA